MIFYDGIGEVNSMIYVNKYGMLKIEDESYDRYDQISEETIEVMDFKQTEGM